jgi:hypothetical protein
MISNKLDLSCLCGLLQYDLSVGTFSPDGRIFQTDYAQKAIDGSGYVQSSLFVFIMSLGASYLHIGHARSGAFTQSMIRQHFTLG